MDTVAAGTFGDGWAALALVALVAAGFGVLAGGLAARLRSRRQERLLPPVSEPPLPVGVGQVLSVLRSLAVVLDEADLVVRASPAAYSFGLVRGGRLVPTELVVLARRVRRDGEIQQAELELPRGPVGGSATRAVSARIAPLGARHVLVLVEDKTDARRIDAVRRDFVANVSHELKTPVGALALLAEAVLDASDDPEAVRRFATRMLKESERLSNLVQELIDLSRLESRDPLTEAVPADIDAVVAAALDRTGAIAAAKDITLVRGGESGLKVLGNEKQLAMALGNLVENAVNYSPEHTRVAIGVQRGGDLAEISVTDQGIGIPEAGLERVFECFYRVDPARSRATGGTGLGLSIVKHVAQNHGGEVRVWSVEGAGSTFTLRLPLLSPAARRVTPTEEKIP